MSSRIPRREALRRLAVISAGAAVPAWLLSCKSKPNCEDVTGLSADDINQRNNIAQYTAQTPDPAKRCDGCAQFVAGPQNACATCKVVKGPIDPAGYCKLWVAKPPA